MRAGGSQPPPTGVRQGSATGPQLALLGAVTVVGALARFLRLGADPGFAWDEAYYVPAARAYLDGDLSLNGEHPPLGKWAIAAGIEALGDEPSGWRAAVLVAGIVTIPLAWLLARRLLGSGWWAALVAGFVATDGLLVVHSRTATLDGLLPPLLVGAALCAVVHLDRSRRQDLSPWLLGAGALLGAAAAVKWQAVPVLAGAALAFAIPGRGDRRALVTAAVAFVAVPLAVYAATYAGHVADGMTPAAWLRLQGDMVEYHRHFRVDHVADSSPITWLLLQRPVSYGETQGAGRIAITLALGNPVLWWSFVASLPVLVVTWWRRRDRTVELVLLAEATLHLSWLVVLRPGFLYYLTPLVPFMALGVAWTLRRVGRAALTAAVAGAAAIAFVAYLPVWTHQSISEGWFDTLMLFDSWEP
jgi:dolichyl-phosphate-mannose-protein mannosyltransferase